MDSQRGAEDVLRGCDPSQRAAITSMDMPLLVVAGAGSGKTRVLTRRIAWRIASGSATPTATLALTFTRKAASELRSRLASFGLASPVTAGTFHAIALAQLRQRALERGRPLPVLVESKARILGPLLPEWGNRRAGRAPLDRRDLISGIASEIEWAKARLIAPEHYATEAARAGRTPPVDLEAAAEGFARYEIERKRRRLYDFDDLLTTLSELIFRDPDFAATQRWRFRHLHVDELQDANAAQIRLLDAWLGDSGDLFCVGDARQAIYGWNGADPSAMDNFAARYAGASVLKLSTNYRSSAQIVRFAGAALPKTQGDAVAAREDGPVPTLTGYACDTDEAIAVAEQIRRLARSRRRFGDCAVLARTNAQLALFERALEAIGIPFRQRGAEQFLARPEIRRALSTLHTGVDRRQSGTRAFQNWLGDLRIEPVDEVEDDEVEPRNGEVGSVAGDERSDLDALALIAEEYADLEPVPSPDGFQSYLDQTLREDLVPATADAVDLLSFHRAKGLEWPIVFVVGLEDGYVPIAHAKTRAALGEEQRLLYVALSRASDELHCSWSRERTFGKRALKREPSPHLEQILATHRRLIEEQRIDPEAARRALRKTRELLRSSDPRP